MIRYIKRNQIDITKYDNCIKLAVNSRIYAYSWYLDIVADNWDVLVLNDYEAVMPLPWRSKYFIKYIYPPAWTQQLGVFSEKDISKKLILEFVKAIPKKFKKITIQFNAKNKFQHKNLTEKVNYILPLNKSYDEIYSGFNKNRKRDLEKALKQNLIVEKNISSKEFLEFYLYSKKNYKLHPNQISTLKKLLSVENEAVNIWGIKKERKLIAGLIWLKDDRRVTYLLPVANNEAKNIGLTTLIILELIKQYSNTNYIFDFEGSMIKGVADFYKSFGVEVEEYSNFYNSFY